MNRRQVFAGGGAVLLAGVGYVVYTRNVIALRISNTARDAIDLGVTVESAEDILFEDTYELEPDISIVEKVRLTGERPYFVEAESYPDDPWGHTRRREIQSNTSEMHVAYSDPSRLGISDPDNPIRAL